MTTIEFFAEGEPKGQPRPRAGMFRGKARVYDSCSAEGFKNSIRAAARDVRPATPLSGPLHGSITMYFPRPKKHFRTGKNAGVLRDDAPRWHTSKPDMDNVAKAVMDALTDIGVLQDDAMWCEGQLVKQYVDELNTRPGVQVHIEPMTS